MNKQDLIESRMETLIDNRNLHVYTVAQTKIVFTKTFNIGFIEDGIFYVIPDFFKGGRGYNAIIESEFKVLEQFYGLKQITTLDLKKMEADNREKLAKIGELLKTEKDPIRFEALARQAISIGNDLPEAQQALQIQIQNMKDLMMQGLSQSEEKKPNPEKPNPLGLKENSESNSGNDEINKMQEQRRSNIAGLMLRMGKTKVKKSAEDYYTAIQIQISNELFSKKEAEQLLSAAKTAHAKKMKEFKK